MFFCYLVLLDAFHFFSQPDTPILETIHKSIWKLKNELLPSKSFQKTGAEIIQPYYLLQ